jgi:hypothetical protein
MASAVVEQRAISARDETARGGCQAQDAAEVFVARCAVR